MSLYRDISAATSPFPWQTPQKLHDDLQSGKLRIATAMSQVSAFIRENLRVIEDYMTEHDGLRTKCDKMDNLLRDLKEKCQSLQQELLFKEEKYDEKCREAERFKVICELSVKGAYNHDFYPTFENNNQCENLESERAGADRPEEVDNEPELELEKEGGSSSRFEHQKIRGPSVDNVEFNRRLEHSAQMLDSRCARPVDNDSDSEHVTQPTASHYVGGPSRRRSSTRMSTADYLDFNGRLERNVRDFNSRSVTSVDNETKSERVTQPTASHYAGGPVKRGPPTTNNNLTNKDAILQERTTSIGAIKSSVCPKIHTGPVSFKHLFGINNTPANSQRGGSNIASVAQRNQVVSSIGAAVQLARRKFTEKELHRQVALGCHTRLSSRRKKGWPF